MEIKDTIKLNEIEEEYEFKTEIKDSKTKIDVNVSNTKWSNKQQNEVTFDINLEAKTIKENMLRNPYIEIELPSEVEKVILGTSNIFYANNLELTEPSININGKGNKVITVSLVGIQDQYYDNELDLVTNVKIPATIILQKDMEQDINEETINVVYANQYTINNSYEIGTQKIELQLENYKEEPEQQELQILREPQNESNKISQELSTQISDKLEVEVTPTISATTLKDNDIIYEGEYIKYNIKITNTTSEDIQNVKIVADIPDGVTYGELETDYYSYRSEYQYNFNEELTEKVINIDLLKAEKSVDMFYEVKVDDLKEESKQITTKINTYIDEALAKTYEIKNTINKAKEQAFLSTLIDFSDSWAYGLNLKSTEEKEVTVKMHFPKEFKMNQIQYVRHIVSNPAEFEGTSTDNAITIYTNYDPLPLDMEEQIRDIDIQITEDNTVIAKLKTNQFYEFIGNIDRASLERTQNGNIAELISYAEIVDDSSTYYSNENRIQIAYQNVSVSMTSPNEGEKVKYGEEIDYQITIKNIGGSQMDEGIQEPVVVDILDYLPDELEPYEVTYNKWDNKIEQYEMRNVTEDITGHLTDTNGEKRPNVNISTSIPKEEIITINVKTKAGSVDKETKIENSATVSGERIDTKITNVVSHIILPEYEDTLGEGDVVDPNTPEVPDNPVNPNNPDDPETPDNPDNPDIPSQDQKEKYNISGIAWLDENEDGIRDSNEGILQGITVMLADVKDSNTIKNKIKTDRDGKYKFENIETGNYLILFQYDTENYTITTYQQNGANNNYNSDAIEKEITLNNKKMKVGITDVIKLDQSYDNINIGLIRNKLCDFKIEKYVSKVSVETKSGTKLYDFHNTNLAKVEIVGKEIDGANVIAEYNIIVTNTGETEGTVGEIIDYIPEGFSFSTTNNNNWKKSTNNTIINNGLSNIKIQPGKSATLTLSLTKTMTNNSTGTFKNRVEIFSGTDSKDEISKNNSSEAELIISVKTGDIVYTSIILFTLIILIILFVYLNKKGLIKFKIISKMSMVIIGIVLLSTTPLLEQKSSDAASVSKGNFPNLSNCAINSYKEAFGNKDTFFKWIYFSSFNSSNSAPHQVSKHTPGITGPNLLSGSGGPFTGHCGNHTLHWCEGTHTYGVVLNNKAGNWGDWTGTKPSISLAKGENNNAEIKVKSFDANNVLIGPFKYTYTGASSPTFTVEVTNASTNGVITGYTICGGAGNAKTIRANNSPFYIKINKNQCTSGINVKLTASKSYNRQRQKTHWVALGYECYDPGCGQPVVSSSYFLDPNPKYTNGKETDTAQGTADDWVNWKQLPVTITLQKSKDSIDPYSRTMSNTVYVLLKSSGNYVKFTDASGNKISNVVGTYNVVGTQNTTDINDATTITTDANGNWQIYGLPKDNYYAVERSCGQYGYTAMTNSSLQSLSSGQISSIPLTNSWQVGNLAIHKIDKATKKALPSVSFKIKNSSGQYAVAYDSNGAEQRTVTGTITLSNMTFDSTGTTFITDANGNIRINYMLAGTYNVIETDVGTSGYKVDPTPHSVTIPKMTSATQVVSMTIENEKNTGNLVISKIDADSNIAMEGVSFKVKAPNGQYIIAQNRYTTYISKQCSRRNYDNSISLYN